MFERLLKRKPAIPDHVLADALAERDEYRDMLATEIEANRWRSIADDGLPPVNTWVLTKHENEQGGWNVCCWVGRANEDEVEWVEMKTGRTTVTHHSFAAPTHWKSINL